jgi:hypothetical protein
MVACCVCRRELCLGYMGGASGLSSARLKGMFRAAVVQGQQERYLPLLLVEECLNLRQAVR